MSFNTVQAEKLLLELQNDVCRRLDAVGLFYRIFSRIKSQASIEKKIREKEAQYKMNGKKIQDVFGMRVTVYFQDDEEIAITLFKKMYEELPEDHSIDRPGNSIFGPERCNLIFKIPYKASQKVLEFSSDIFDHTLEVQFRTVFSEGWHEIEHDLRYKCKQDWEGEDALARVLNSQLAALQSSDWAILKIFEELAHTKYRKGEWSAFFRNVLRIRFTDEVFSPPVIDFLDNNDKLAKMLIRMDRKDLILSISDLTARLPLKMDTVLHVVNRAILHNEHLKTLEPKFLNQILDSSFNKTSITMA